MTIRKAVMPVAGFGTRFLPVTRAVPKNLLPVFDRPSVHLCVEEAVSAGIEDIIFIVSEGQDGPISRYFGPQPGLENALASRNNVELLEQMREIAEMANVSCSIQNEQKGLGHAILMAREEVGDEAFAVFLPDDVIWADIPTIGEMIEVHGATGGNVVALEEVSDTDVPSKGIVAIKRISETRSRILDMVEKPALEDAPSNLAVVGRYVLTAEIFDTLQYTPAGALGEIQLTDAIARHIESPGVYGYHFGGEHQDVGNPLGALKASVTAALKRQDVADDLRAWLSGL
ncbi:MAG: UTP--glucose-1-phosphate uridylyltransferase [Dehalococcoidia bacterium]|nr:UTP--glucose-1-phosphate uridylyltransferase [Dehalococcoidia bacterium]